MITGAREGQSDCHDAKDSQQAIRWFLSLALDWVNNANGEIDPQSGVHDTTAQRSVGH